MTVTSKMGPRVVMQLGNAHWCLRFPAYKGVDEVAKLSCCIRRISSFTCGRVAGCPITSNLGLGDPEVHLKFDRAVIRADSVGVYEEMKRSGRPFSLGL
jgi:hypothetical protein